jgi:hypothetical protein
MNLGNPENYKLTTGRLYWQPNGLAAGDNQWIDLGNIPDYKSDPKFTRVQHFASSLGIRRLDFEPVGNVKEAKMFTLDEHFADTVALLALGTNIGQVVQAAAVNQRFIITVDELSLLTPGEASSFFVGATGLYNATVVGYFSFGAAPNDFLIEDLASIGGQYTLDLGSGMLDLFGPYSLVVPEGAHQGQTWALYQIEVLYSCPQVTATNFQWFSQLLQLGTFKLVEYDQFSTVPLAFENFSGQVEVTAWGDNKLDKFNEYTVEVIHNPATRAVRAY